MREGLRAALTDAHRYAEMPVLLEGYVSDPLASIAERCKQAKITHEVVANAYEEPPQSAQKRLFARNKALRLEVLAGRDPRKVVVPEGPLAEAFARTEFERFRFVAGYEAIWSKDLGIIECLLDFERGPYVYKNPAFLMDRLRRTLKQANPDQDTTGDDRTRVTLPSPVVGLGVAVRQCSPELAALTENFRLYSMGGPDTATPTRTPSLEFSNLHVDKHEDAHVILQKLGNSILFYLDLRLDLRVRLRTPEFTTGRQGYSQVSEPLAPQAVEYDPEPMELYWYGRTSQFPLLRFLAFYQVLEYYYPTYSNREAQETLKQILRSPLFNAYRDTDVAKLLSAVKVSGGGRSFGDELSQLRATLKACVNAEELREFFRSAPWRQAYYGGKDKPWKDLADVQLISDSAALLEQVAERIYKIRCRIVHSKGGFDDQPLLLPFSREISGLTVDSDLVEFVAVRVLSFGSRQLSLPHNSIASVQVARPVAAGALQLDAVELDEVAPRGPVGEEGAVAGGASQSEEQVSQPVGGETPSPAGPNGLPAAPDSTAPAAEDESKVELAPEVSSVEDAAAQSAVDRRQPPSEPVEVSEGSDGGAAKGNEGKDDGDRDGSG